MPFLYKMVNTERDSSLFNFYFNVIVTMITLIGSMTIFILQKKKICLFLACLGSYKKIKNIFFLGDKLLFLLVFFRSIIWPSSLLYTEKFIFTSEDFR